MADQVSDTGHYEFVVAKRAALVSRMSPSAKHLAFPKLYARPVMVEETKMLGKVGMPTAPPMPVFAPTAPRLRLPLKPAPAVSSHWGAAKHAAEANRSQIREIIRVCEFWWDVPTGSILAHRRPPRHVRPRHAAMKLIRDLLGIATTAIGWALAKRDHSTVCSGLTRAAEQIETDPGYRARYEAALAELTSTGPAPQIPVPAAHSGSGERPSSHSPARLDAR